MCMQWAMQQTVGKALQDGGQLSHLCRAATLCTLRGHRTDHGISSSLQSVMMPDVRFRGRTASDWIITLPNSLKRLVKLVILSTFIWIFIYARADTKRRQGPSVKWVIASRWRCYVFVDSFLSSLKKTNTHTINAQYETQRWRVETVNRDLACPTNLMIVERTPPNINTSNK